MIQHHILNGDSLLNSFPHQIHGERIVARECLVDGDVRGESLEELFANRAAFLMDYSDGSDDDYYEKSVPEFKKIQIIPAGSEVNLWFEDDLFCQVNLWFVCHLLVENNKPYSVYLVRPTSSLRFGFAGMSMTDLIGAFDIRIKIPNADLTLFKSMWLYYQKDETAAMLQIAKESAKRYPFLLPAVVAHLERFPGENQEGKPERLLRIIMNELNTKEFGPVFREFCMREPIYGFGDSQVERMWRKIAEEK